MDVIKFIFYYVHRTLVSPHLTVPRLSYAFCGGGYTSELLVDQSINNLIVLPSVHIKCVLFVISRIKSIVGFGPPCYVS